MKIELSLREQAQTVAALRHWQSHLEADRMPEEVEIMELDDHEPMSATELEELCNRFIYY